jgi:predicted RNase H-like HicB family nuclease
MKIKYPIKIQYIEFEGDDYFLAYLPDFGVTACSATGDTIQEAIAALQKVYWEVVEHYSKIAKDIPEPSSNAILEKVAAHKDLKRTINKRGSSQKAVLLYLADTAEPVTVQEVGAALYEKVRASYISGTVTETPTDILRHSWAGRILYRLCQQNLIYATSTKPRKYGIDPKTASVVKELRHRFKI